MFRRTLLLATLLVVGLPTAAWAQEYPTTPDESLTVSDASLAPGDPLTISGQGFAPGSSATATLFSRPMELGTFTADGGGAVRGQVAIPEGTSAGAHRLELAGVAPDGSALVLTAQVTVAGGTGSSDRSESSGLAFTGTSVTALLAAAVVLIAVGAGALVLSRRRRVAQT
jgi:hypothetical protein